MSPADLRDQLDRRARIKIANAAAIAWEEASNEASRQWFNCSPRDERGRMQRLWLKWDFDNRSREARHEASRLEAEREAESVATDSTVRAVQEATS